ncbi:MAG: hypothetical protein ACYDBV_07690 [Nitrospiria bacterium]
MKKSLLVLVMIFTLFIHKTTYANSNITFQTTGPNVLAQDEFRSLSKEVGIAIVDLPMTPAAPLGIAGFDIGVEATVVNIHNNDPFWTKATSSPPSALVIPKIHAQKGLPGNIDVGVVYSSVPNSNISIVGGELKYAILEGSVATPAVALRGSYTKLNGVSDLNLTSSEADLSISKGFGFLTPYAGIAEVFIQSSATNAALNLNSENIQAVRGFVGAKLSMVFVNLVGQIDVGELTAYSLRLNVGF